MSLYKGEYRASVSQGKERNLAIRFILSHKCRVIQEAKSLTSDQKKIGQLKQFV